MKTKIITPVQYADWYGCSLQYVVRCLKAGTPKLDEIISYTNYSRFYAIEVSASLDVNTIETAKTNLKIKFPKAYRYHAK